MQLPAGPARTGFRGYNPGHGADRVALGIWKDRVESLIDTVKPKADREAIRPLADMPQLPKETGREGEYRAYIAALRARHRAERRRMEELDFRERKHRKILEERSSGEQSDEVGTGSFAVEKQRIQTDTKMALSGGSGVPEPAVSGPAFPTAISQKQPSPTGLR